MRTFYVTLSIEEPDDVDLVNDNDTMGDRLKYVPNYGLVKVEEVTK